MGAKSKRKGKRGELEAAAEIARLFRVEARRGQQYCGGEESPDIKTPIPRLHFEVKRTESLQLYAALDQATEDAGDQIPIVLHRRNGREWVAILRLDDLPAACVQLYLTLMQQK